MVEKTAKEIKNHMQSEHEHIEQRETSREVCWHWRQGNCFRGDNCHFSHVGHQKSLNITRDASTKAKTCKNGQNCRWKERGECQYFHHGIGVQKPQGVHRLQGERQGQRGNHEAYEPAQRRQMCRWNDNCFRKETCKFAHTAQRNFHQNSRNQPRPIMRNLVRNQRRN